MRGSAGRNAVVCVKKFQLAVFEDSKRVLHCGQNGHSQAA